MTSNNVGPFDWVVIAGYFCFCIFLGIWSKFRKQADEQETAETYFLAGRSMLWWAVGGSLFASNIGSEHFVGLAGSGAATGIGVVAYEWQASWILLLLGYFFVPIYIRSKIFTMPEYLKKRFQSKYMRAYMTVVSLLSYVTTKISVDMYAGGVFLKEVMGWNIYVSSFVILAITALYTLMGGLAAVIYTDVLQCTIMIIGAIALSAVGFKKIGGIGALWEQYPNAVGKAIVKATATTATKTNITTAATTVVTMTTIISTVATNLTTMATNSTRVAGGRSVDTCYKVDPNWNHLFRSYDDPEYPWIGVWFSLPVTGIWYWCTDQVIVQRTLGAKNIGHARAGAIFAGFLKILPMYIMVMPGMISRVLYKETIACSDPAACFAYCGNKFGCSNSAYPKLVLNILPTGAVGLMLAVMMAAVMSSLSSAFHSSSTIFTIDIWKLFRPRSSERELLIVGQVVVVVMAIIGLIWLPIVSSGHGGQLFKYLQTIQSYLAPPACATFLIGMLWPRLTEVGALTSMVFGLFLGIIRLAMDVTYPQPHCGAIDNRPGFVKLHFMYYAIVIFCSCVVLMVVISLFTEPVPLEYLGALTWPTINNKPRSRGVHVTVQNVVRVEDKGTNTSRPPGIGGEEDVGIGMASAARAKAALTIDELVLAPAEDEQDSEQGSEQDSEQDSEQELREIKELDRQQELREIKEFEDQDPRLKLALKGSTFFLLLTLAFLWIYYR